MAGSLRAALMAITGLTPRMCTLLSNQPGERQNCKAGVIFQERRPLVPSDPTAGIMVPERTHTEFCSNCQGGHYGNGPSQVGGSPRETLEGGL